MHHPAIRIAVLHFSHETVTFLNNDTTLDDFVYPGSPAKGEALLGSYPKSYMGGFVKMAREFDGVELTGIESPLWPKTGIGSGWVTEQAFETFVGKMISGIEAEAPFDGVYLCVHGAMAVRGVPRPEAELAWRVRQAVGPKAFIAATFDLHGNEDEAFLQHADMAFAVKYFPHYDEYLQGERAARTLVRAIRGDYKPVHVTLRIPVISPTVLQWTGASPWMDLVQRALTWEAREPDTYVNIFFGFPFADVPDVGMTVQVLTNSNPELAARVGRDISSAIWRVREALLKSTSIHSIAAGVALAKQAVVSGATPVVLADHSDRSGSATWLLREIVTQGLSNTLIATIADAGVTAKLKAAGAKEGDSFDMDVGGLVDESAGEPVRIQGTILKAVEGHGQFWVCIAFGRNNVLILSTYLVQVMEPFSLKALGLDIASFDVMAIKSRVHFRRGFDDNGFAKTILLVEPEQPFLGTTRLEGLPYRNVDLGAYYPYGNPVFPV
ncbi:M81 family metallopeptidase [Bradyrhizobium sp. KBS0727]|uniref:M81 family metallopeptidase n=1 Tax=unclassified Bradyrhizobium TaxID=2631580 RepID=UPI00110E84CA|nr:MULTISPECIES: M81 family metallopeptidase [unclassified Bradyrhizobium]QDW37375.1 M81 family metallopeptidase [Bradyrhizobium sp. KBS0725]QDW43978.1 M81 family metallopeptidase [Bradyrhizobium sp. KBS0727]